MKVTFIGVGSAVFFPELIKDILLIDRLNNVPITLGALFKALITLLKWFDIVNDIMEYCPNALVMNNTNPMSLTVLAALRATVNKIRVVGLCHSIQTTSQKLAEYLGIPYEELNWRAAGINQMAWFVELADKDGDDLVVQSVLDQNRKKAFHALMINPLTSAVCSLDEIQVMFEEMIISGKEFLPEYIRLCDVGVKVIDI